MKRIITVELTEEEKEKLRSVADIDICEGIDCSGFGGCEGCPLKKAAELKEDIDRIIRNLLR